MTLIQFIGGIALLGIGGGALIWLVFIVAGARAIASGLRSPLMRPLKNGGDEHSKTLGVRGESFIHGEPTK